MRQTEWAKSIPDGQPSDYPGCSHRGAQGGPDRCRVFDESQTNQKRITHVDGQNWTERDNIASVLISLTKMTSGTLARREVADWSAYRRRTNGSGDADNRGWVVVVVGFSLGLGEA
ncbi:hypothetical protein RRG08_056854 [Elysia crispata]|uniref:Uncharacterized protein n=1 Tax=Elysia crispata TaxID=231223 RepID=A0AAE1ABM6_9GAST|nr:hypothetical protein RRG08_056854 [Elysia crispata]